MGRGEEGVHGRRRHKAPQLIEKLIEKERGSWNENEMKSNRQRKMLVNYKLRGSRNDRVEVETDRCMAWFEKGQENTQELWKWSLRGFSFCAEMYICSRGIKEN